VFYFVYCTWLHEAEMRRYVPDAKYVTKAVAKNHKLEFRAAGNRQDRGWCHLSNKGDAFGVATQGIVVDVDKSHQKENYDDFDIVYLTVHGIDGVVYDCFTYILSNPGVPMRPPNFYWQHIPEGLKEQGFPEAYRTFVQSTYEAAAECPDADRPAPSAKPGKDARTR